MWEVMVPVMNQLLSSALALACRQRSLADIAERGLQDNAWRWTMDEAYVVTLHNTVGTLTLPLFAYRDTSTAVAAVTRTPAFDLLPHRRHCRSTPLLLQAESRVAAHFPFEQAQAALHPTRPSLAVPASAHPLERRWTPSGTPPDGLVMALAGFVTALDPLGTPSRGSPERSRGSPERSGGSPERSGGAPERSRGPSMARQGGRRGYPRGRGRPRGSRAPAEGSRSRHTGSPSRHEEAQRASQRVRRRSRRRPGLQSQPSA